MAHSSTSDTSHLLTAAEFDDEIDATLVQSPIELLFKPLRTVVYAVIQICLNIALLSESVIFLRLTSYCNHHNETKIAGNASPPSKYKVISCSSIMVYSSIFVWILTWLLKEVLRYFHDNHRLTGYLQLYRKIEHMGRIPFSTMTLGNALLLIAMALRLDDHIPMAPMNKIDETPFWLLLQIICCLEGIIITVTMVVYIAKVARFNKSGADPDVFQVNRPSSMPLRTNAGTTIEVGPGVRVVPQEVARLQQVCQQQADLMEYLRHRCDVLAGRLYQVSNAPTHS